MYISDYISYKVPFFLKVNFEEFIIVLEPVIAGNRKCLGGGGDLCFNELVFFFFFGERKIKSIVILLAAKQVSTVGIAKTE